MTAATTGRILDAMSEDRDARVVSSWRTNAAAWTRAVRGGNIQSRRLVTDRAIVEAVTERAPATVLDVGCGEGWLARALSAAGARVIGVDVVPALVDRARAAGGGDFHVASYADVAAGAFASPFDAVVCNFSLIGKEPVDAFVATAPSLLTPRGAVIVQTIHPAFAGGDAPYVDGWREGSWAGFGADFTDPAPWYFRTVESWVSLLVGAGLRLAALREPSHPHTGKPASVIFIAARA